MSMNLHLYVKLFQREIEIPLWQTPTRIATNSMTKQEYLKAYVDWMQKELLPNAPEDKDEIEDHLTRVQFYCTHMTHEWFWG
jgi:hypothetical protein